MKPNDWRCHICLGLNGHRFDCPQQSDQCQFVFPTGERCLLVASVEHGHGSKPAAPPFVPVVGQRYRGTFEYRDPYGDGAQFYPRGTPRRVSRTQREMWQWANEMNVAVRPRLTRPGEWAAYRTDMDGPNDPCEYAKTRIGALRKLRREVERGAK